MVSRDPIAGLKYLYWLTLENSGQITLDVYKDAVPITENGNYILVRSDGASSAELNNSTFITNAVIVVDIVTKFETIGNSNLAYQMADNIQKLILQAPNQFFYGSIAEHNITQITLQTQDEIYEDDGSEKIFRIIQRYEHSLTQK